MNYQYFADRLLAAAYLEMNEGRQGLSAGQLMDLYGLQGRTGWVEAAIDEFAARGWVESDPTMGDERQLTVFLRGRGLRAAEQILESGNKPQKKASLPPGITDVTSGRTFLVESEVPADLGGPGDIFLHTPPKSDQNVDQQPLIPAADRIVRLDHNSAQVQTAISATEDLAKQLKEKNDIGNLSAEAAAVAVIEVEQIATDLKQPAIRLPAFAERAKSTLSWIGKEAAGAVVGAAALALLALIGALIGGLL